MLPTSFGTLAAAGVVLAWEGLVVMVAGRDGERAAEGRGEVGDTQMEMGRGIARDLSRRGRVNSLGKDENRRLRRARKPDELDSHLESDS